MNKLQINLTKMSPKFLYEIVKEKFFRYLWGDDIFISYSRADATTYALGLANELLSPPRNFSCKFDQWGTQPGKDIPEPLKKALHRSAVLVLVSSEAATKSKAVRWEIEEFTKTGRMVIPIDLDGKIQTAPWWSVIEGLPIFNEIPNAIKNGQPHLDIIDRIDKTFNFSR